MENVFVKNKSLLKKIIPAFFCSLIVILARIPPFRTVIHIGNLYFSYTDFFIIVTTGIGGMSSAIVSFSCIFIASLFCTTPDFSNVYTLFTYLIEIYLASFFMRNRFYASFAKSLLPFFTFTAALTFFWELMFEVLNEEQLIRSSVSTLEYALTAIPETFLAVLVQYLYFRNSHISQAKEKTSILASRMAFMSMLEAVVLCAVSIFFFSVENKNTTNFREIAQLSMIFLSASIPLAYLFNSQIKKYIISPLNAMSFLMDMTADKEDKSLRDVPELIVKTGDEIEKLFKSLYKMIADMSDYYERIIDSERRATALTEGFMTALAKAVDEKDHYTAGHSVRVAKIAREIARRMGKSEEELQNIYYIGLVHDIGKIGIQGVIINKKCKLTEEEYKDIKEHTMKGYFILKNVSEMPTLSIGARWHHERYDGKGYPDGLKGKEIPEIARIIAVADTYDAMTSHRTYSSPKDRNTVRNEIIMERGKQFDPHIANILVTMIDDGTVNFL